jgi:hypothetical protein
MKIQSITIVLFFLLFSMSCSTTKPVINQLKSGSPNTVTLSNGEVIYDLNGEWDAIFDNKSYGKDEDIVKITQEGKKFVGIKLIGNQYVGKGEKTMRGELQGDGFKSIDGFSLAGGWQSNIGKISDGGNKIVLEQQIQVPKYISVVTLTRK